MKRALVLVVIRVREDVLVLLHHDRTVLRAFGLEHAAIVQDRIEELRKNASKPRIRVNVFATELEARRFFLAAIQAQVGKNTRARADPSKCSRVGGSCRLLKHHIIFQNSA